MLFIDKGSIRSQPDYVTSENPQTQQCPLHKKPKEDKKIGIKIKNVFVTGR